MPLDGAAGDPVHAAPPIVHEVLRSSGHPLDLSTRAFFEPRFGHDFGRVRVHTDLRAAESAASVHAEAYTAGHDIVFGAGRYAPGTVAGRRLLAHELAHVGQQREALAARPADLRVGGPADPAEGEARTAADRVLSGSAAPPVVSSSSGVLRRQGPAGSVRVSALRVNIGSSGLTIAHVPPCTGQPAIRFTAAPAGAAPVTWSLDPESAAVAAGTALVPSATTLTAELTLGPAQKGGTLRVAAESSQGGQSMDYPLASHPTGITSTSVIGDPANTTLYGGVFDHVFTSDDGQASSLDQVAVGEKFPSVPNPNGTTHTFPTPFGTFTLTTGTLPNTPGATGNWFLTSTGELGGSHDTVGIQKSMVDIGRHLASDSNPHPTHPLPAGFAVDQQFFWWCPHAPAGRRWTQAAATTHTRRLRLDATGTGAEFVAIVNGQENPMRYEGRTGVTNARADPAVVAPSAPGGPASTVQISADAFPSSRPLYFSLRGNAHGCTINHATGELTIGRATGTVTVHAANSSGGPNWDEVDVTIAAPAPAPGAAPGSAGPAPAPAPAPPGGGPGRRMGASTAIKAGGTDDGHGSRQLHGLVRAFPARVEAALTGPGGPPDAPPQPARPVKVKDWGRLEPKTEAEVGGGTVKAHLDVTAVSRSFSGSAYSLSYRGPDVDRKRWLQFIWREAVAEFPAVRGGKPRTERAKAELEHSGLKYALTTDPSKPDWTTDTGTKSSPFLEENTEAVNRSAESLTMFDDPSPREDIVAAVFASASPPARVVSHFHAATYLVDGMDVLYRADIDITWEFKSATDRPDPKMVAKGGSATRLDPAHRARLSSQFSGYGDLK